jgi:hypothetical protein
MVSKVYGSEMQTSIAYQFRESNAHSLRCEASRHQSWARQAHLFLWPLAWSCWETSVVGGPLNA